MPLSPNGLWEAEMTTAGRSRLTEARPSRGREDAHVDDVGALAGQARAEGGLQHGTGPPRVAADEEGLAVMVRATARPRASTSSG